jgi:hypothetical protein
VGVGIALLVGAALGVSTARVSQAGWRRRLILILSAGVGSLLLIRGIGIDVLLLSGSLDGNSGIGSGKRHWSLVLWNPWFVLGGGSFLLAAAGLSRREARPPLRGGRRWARVPG